MKLYTLTGNLLAERTFDYDSWVPGATQRARNASFQVGGKGINVSRMLQRLGTPATTLCFVGGETGETCRAWLEERRLAPQAFITQNETRTGLVVRSRQQPETTFLGPDSPADAEALLECARFLDGLPKGASLAICGSFPGWDSAGAAPLRESLTRWIAQRSLFVDTYGPPLEWCVAQPVSLVKVNAAEFDQLWPESERGHPLEARLLEALKRWPVRAWMVTDGSRDVIVASRDEGLHRFTPPKVQEVSPTGSGDVYFACVLHGMLHRGMSLHDAAKFALPYAAANAAHPGVAEFDLNHLPTQRS